MRSLLDAARFADEAGLYGIHIGEHVVMGRDADSYPYKLPYGGFQHVPETPWFESMTALAAVGAVTSHVRLGTGIMLTALRPAVVTAKSLATIDVLSNGRIEPGVGIGWQKAEFDAAGVDWKHRYSIFYDGLAACRKLWGRKQPVTWKSSYTDLDEVWCLPAPVQERIPVLFGVAVTPKSSARIAELGDGWCPFGISLEDVRVGVDVLREAFTEAGRSPDELIVRVSSHRVTTSGGRIDINRTVEQFPDIEAAGGTVVSVGPPQGLNTMSEVESFMHELAEASS
jgi:probable F420-dependent oxidoreductase